MLGLPGESRDDMLATAREVARLRLDAVKMHNLYVVHNTPLAEQLAAGQVSCWSATNIFQPWSIFWSYSPRRRAS